MFHKHLKDHGQDDRNCGPVPGSLQAFGMQITKSSVTQHSPVVDLLVTTNIQRGVVLGFRFFKHGDDYMTPKSASVTFALSECLLPGNFLRLENCGRSLVVRRSAGVWVSAAPSAPQPVHIPAKACCFIFWLPTTSEVSGISFIGVSTRTHEAIAPPVHVLPCEFSTIVSLCKLEDADAEDAEDDDDDEDGTHHDTVSCCSESCSSSYIVFNGCRRDVASSWIRAWQLFRYTHANKWARCSLATVYNDMVQELATTLYVCPVPGQLVPLAFRPCDADEGGASIFPAELVVLVTSELPPATRVWVVPNCSNPENVRAEALWLWTSPCKAWVPAGTSVVLSGLSADHYPRTSLGQITRTGGWPAHGFSIFEVTLYGMALEVPADRRRHCNSLEAHAITALYTCAAQGGLAPGLVLGESVHSVPWPCHAGIVPIDACPRPRDIPRDWLYEKLKILKTRPVRWLCQPVPVFRKQTRGRRPHEDAASPIFGPMSGGGC